ncbi:MAG: hypothetical protein MSH15_00420 [Oscillospiraceae bacterium]|nr:hypothetical protein [Oscillospiraceae bacterium]
MNKICTNILSLLAVGLLFTSCQSDNDDSGPKKDIVSFEIKNGKYCSLNDNSYVEITDGKYFQLVDWDPELLEQIRQYYSTNGFSNIMQQNSLRGINLTQQETDEINERCKNSTQIIDDLVNNRAEFIINKCDESLSQMMIEDVGTDTEITYKLDDYELWFPFNYHYINNEYKLTNQQFGWEFCLEN